MTTTEVQVLTDDQKQMRDHRLGLQRAIPFSMTGGVNPTTYEQLVEVAKVFAASGYFKDASEYTKAIAKIQYGAELGIPLIASLNNIYIIEGKPSLSAALIAARIKTSGIVRFKVSEWTNEKCILEWFRLYDVTTRNWEKEGESSWSIEDTRQAQLANRDNHKKYPKAMNFARALTQGARAYASELFFGTVYEHEEIQDELYVEPVKTTKTEKVIENIEKIKLSASKPTTSTSTIQPTNEEIKKEIIKTETPIAKVLAAEEVFEKIDTEPTIENARAKGPEEKKPEPSPSIQAATASVTQSFSESATQSTPTAPSGQLATSALHLAFMAIPETPAELAAHNKKYKETLTPDQQLILRATLKAKAQFIQSKDSLWKMPKDEVLLAIQGMKLAREANPNMPNETEFEAELNNQIKE